MSTETENGTPLISDMFGQMMFLMPSAGVSEHPVRISRSQESGQDLTATSKKLKIRRDNMNVAIIDADLLGRKNHRFPNLVCMKLSSYFKSQGNNVVFENIHFTSAVGATGKATYNNCTFGSWAICAS